MPGEHSAWPKASEIAVYWGLLPVGHPDLLTDEFAVPVIGFVDIGEPACFRCGYWTLVWDTGKAHERRWDSATGIHRIPVTKKPSEPRDFILICDECVRTAPKATDDRSVVMSWVRSKPIMPGSLRALIQGAERKTGKELPPKLKIEMSLLGLDNDQAVELLIDAAAARTRPEDYEKDVLPVATSHGDPPPTMTKSTPPNPVPASPDPDEEVPF